MGGDVSRRGRASSTDWTQTSLTSARPTIVSSLAHKIPYDENPPTSKDGTGPVSLLSQM